MIEILLPAAILYLLGKTSKASTPLTKYYPKEQPSFKAKLKPILKQLEKDLKAPGLYDFFMGVARIESRWYPDAIRYESTGYNLVKPCIRDSNNKCLKKNGVILRKDFKSRYKENPWRKSPYLWNYTGGLFQLFPGTALYTADYSAKNYDPTTVFDPYYTIAYAIDLASRFNKNHGADQWVKIRYGWNSLRTLLYYDGTMTKEAERVGKKIHNAILENGADPSFLYDYRPNLFAYYRENYGFQKLLKHIQSMKE